MVESHQMDDSGQYLYGDDQTEPCIYKEMFSKDLTVFIAQMD